MKFLAVVLLFLGAIAIDAQTPHQLEKQIVGHLKVISATGTYSGTYEDKKLYAANRDLKAALMKGGSSLATLKYAFPALKEMYVATSKDGKFRIYSWDMETGGTMHDFDSVFQYQGMSGKVYTWSETDEDESAGSFYSQIFQVQGPKGAIYLANGNFIGSSSYGGQSLQAFVVNGEKLDRKPKVIRTSEGMTNSISFAYDFFSVVDRPERPVRLFTFDAVKKQFSFPVVIEDEETPQGRVTSKQITYRFNGRGFSRGR